MVLHNRVWESSSTPGFFLLSYLKNSDPFQRSFFLFKLECPKIWIIVSLPPGAGKQMKTVFRDFDAAPLISRQMKITSGKLRTF